ncbi:MAG: hydroxyproline-2-epimerase [Planctomycetes bacterium]|nr:hydroxyproline-2-epimerase [Planctomycetota bacterium]
MAGSGQLNEACSGIRVVDSHTEGEPTRVVLSGGPDLGPGPLAERLRRFRATADDFRRAVILEPRGSEALVGALICEPHDRSCAAGVIYFNNAGFLGMCGHGTIGVAVTLAYLGRIGIGTHRLETPVGIVEVRLLSPNEVAIENVPSFRYRSRVAVQVAPFGTVFGDIAWGGNWFFLVEESPFPLTADNIRALNDAAHQIRIALRQQRITGIDDAEIDHVEFFGPAQSAAANSRNFVYCPGGAFDRSPCGTGTSAKLACLAADGKLEPGASWVQESIIGSRFSASYRHDENGRIIPTVSGRAYVCAEANLIQQPDDPFRNGIAFGSGS